MSVRHVSTADDFTHIVRASIYLMNILCETLNNCYKLVRGFHFTMRLKISLAIETGKAHKAFSPEVIVPSSQDAHSLPTDC